MITFAKEMSPDWVLTFAEGEEKALDVRPGEEARTLRVSLGREPDLELVRRAAAKALRTVAQLGGGSALLQGGEVYERLGAEGLAALVQGARLAQYKAPTWGADKGPEAVACALEAPETGETQAAVAEANILADAVCFARDLVNTPASHLTPAELARRVAPQDSPILLVGETGTGKEIFAQSIHRASRRRGGKFLAINCAAVPETLIESLLFGTKKGSFTGSEDKAGYLEEAAGGTLFLDELNSMSLAMQSKILRVLQEKTFRRVGGSQDLRLDVRVISSCNEDPFKAISENTFRRDLFYRLSTVMIELPPLRDHMEDLEELIRYRLDATAYQFVRAVTRIEPEVYALLRSYHWPGNVRELFHVLDYAQNVTDSEFIGPRHLPPYLLKHRAEPAPPIQPVDFSQKTLQGLMDDYERQIIAQALEHCGYNISQTAQTLGILRQSLQYRIRKYGLIF